MPSEAHRRLTRARELRTNATLPELRLWHALSYYRPRFTRQLPVGPYYADFACRSARLVVELDGSQHVDCERDEVRTAKLEALGWRVIRFWNGDVLANTEGVVTAIVEAGNPRLPPGVTFEAIHHGPAEYVVFVQEQKNHPQPLQQVLEGSKKEARSFC